MKAQILIGAIIGVLVTSSRAANASPPLLPTPTQTNTAVATTAHTPTSTPTPSQTATPSPAVTIANTPTLTPTLTPTNVPATSTATLVHTPTATIEPTSSPSPTPFIVAAKVKSSKSNSSDRLLSSLVTASVALSGASDVQRVYKTPASGDFILTQVCVSAGVEGGIQLNAAGLGAIAQLSGQARSCEIFDPGFILPLSSAITCSTSEAAPPGNYFCMISGLLAPL